MLHARKTNILTTIQLAAEVNAALKENTVVVVTRRQLQTGADMAAYDVYAGQGKVEDGQIVDHQK